MEFRILGPIEAVAEDGELVRIPHGRARTVLAVLCYEAGRELSAGRLIRLCWNGDPPPTAQTQLQGMISALRRLFGVDRDVLQTRGQGYALTARVDLAQMRVLAVRARQEMVDQRFDEAAIDFEAAIALWRGRPFDGVDNGELAAIAEVLEQEYVSVLEDYASIELDRGNLATLAGPLAGWVSMYPLRERLVGSQIELLARSGRQAEGIAAYHRLRVQLADDLGVDPGPELRELYQRLLRGELSSPAEPKPPGPAQLPASVGDFAGRMQSITQLLEALAAGSEQPHGTPVMAAITGIGGIGKSTLAVHIAHRIAQAYPDGQLYVALAGTTSEPLVPEVVLARLLRDLGTPPTRIPSDVEELSACFRSRVAGRRILMVLDDGRDAAQIRPLLPGTGSCAVLITSRARLSDLDGAVHVSLGGLDPEGARDLFIRIVGDGRTRAEPESTDRVLACCAGLPLAIRIVAVKLAARPGWTIGAVADRLTAERDRLAQLHCGDLQVRAGFQLSYDNLPRAEAAAFRLAGLLPSGHFSLGAAAAVLGADAAEAERVLETLCEMHLVETPSPQQYQMHDLIRLFARELAASALEREERDAATTRLISWYWTAAQVAEEKVSESREILDFAQPEPAAASMLPVVASFQDGIRWFLQEEDHLIAIITAAAEKGLHAAVVGLTALFARFTVHSGFRQGHRAIYDLALVSARARADLHAEGWLLCALGDHFASAGDHLTAITHHEQALAIQLALGSRRHAAASLNDIAVVYHNQGRYDQALINFCRAEELARSLPKPGILIAVLIANQAQCLHAVGDFEPALKLYDRALRAARDSADRPTQAATMSLRAVTLHRLNRLDEARAQHYAALVLHRELGGAGPDFIAALDAYSDTLQALGRNQEAAAARAEAGVVARERDLNRREERSNPPPI